MIEELLKQKREMIEYLKLKLSIEDFHGVQDAASDIREIDAQIKLLRLLEASNAANNTDRHLKHQEEVPGVQTDKTAQ